VVICRLLSILFPRGRAPSSVEVQRSHKKAFFFLSWSYRREISLVVQMHDPPGRNRQVLLFGFTVVSSSPSFPRSPSLRKIFFLRSCPLLRWPAATDLPFFFGMLETRLFIPRWVDPERFCSQCTLDLAVDRSMSSPRLPFFHARLA